MFHQHAAFGMRLRMLAIDGANAIDNRPEFLLSRSSWLMPAVPPLSDASKYFVVL
jgi:hypothetical protein